MPPRRQPSGKGLAVRTPAHSARSASLDPSARALAAPTYDWLRLAGVQAYGHLGVTAKERDLGQRVEVDIELAYPVPRSRRLDSLEACFDYEEVGRVIRSQIEMSRCKLIETLAEELAILLLEAFDTPRVRVRLRKLHIPVSGFSGIPEIEVERSRS
jgi:dihydroneopterin aldolase